MINGPRHLTCCHEFVNGWTGISPFARSIVLGYYDGPTHGVTKCSACGADYEFSLLAWDEGQDERVFEFWTMRRGAFARVESQAKAELRPEYPQWVIFSNLLSCSCRGQLEQVLQEESQQRRESTFVLI